jgi:hypothetical protein
MLFINKVYAFFRRIDKGATYKFEDLWSFEKTIEVTVVDSDLGVEKDRHFFRLLIALLDNVIFIIFKISISLIHISFDFINNGLRNLLLFHNLVRTISNVFHSDTYLMIKFMHIPKPIYFLVC